jgi:hypothetical protein
VSVYLSHDSHAPLLITWLNQLGLINSSTQLGHSIPPHDVREWACEAGDSHELPLINNPTQPVVN